jgi:hypothetical protein
MLLLQERGSINDNLPMSFGKRAAGSEAGKSVESEKVVKPSPETNDSSGCIENINMRATSPTRIIDERPYVKVDIYGKHFMALVDTGAMMTFISDDVAQHLAENNVKSTKPNLKVHLANNSQASVKESYQFEISLGQSKFLFEAIHVTNLSTSVILGIDLLKKLNLITVNLPILDRSQERLKFRPNLAQICTLTHDEEEILRSFLEKELEMFNEVTGRTDIVQHEIRLKTRHPVK